MEFTPLSKFENGLSRDMEEYKFTNEKEFASLKETLLNNNDGMFLEHLITKMARNDLQCLREDPLNVISDSIKSDYVQIFKDYVHYNPESCDDNHASLLDIKEDFNQDVAPENLRSFIQVPTRSRFLGINGGGVYTFESILFGVGIMIPSIVQSNPDITFETLMPNFCNALRSETYCAKLLFKFSNIGKIDDLFAPSEGRLDKQLPINNKILNDVHAFLVSLVESTGIEIVNNNGELVFSTELESTDPINLCVRKRSKYNSEETISKNSIPAIPLHIKGKIFEKHKMHRAQSCNITEYFEKGTGKEYQERIVYFQVEVTYKFAFVPQSNKRLLVSPSKSYKIYDTNSVSIMVNTLKTMIDNPGTMHLDLESGLSNLVLRNDKLYRSRSDSDMRSAINEQLRKKWQKMDGKTFFSFLEDITGQQPDRKARLSDYNLFRNVSGFGIYSSLVEFSDRLPATADAYLENLRSLKSIFGALLEEAETLEAFLANKFKELEIDPNSKISLRDLIIKIIASEVKVDPLTLSSKGGYLEEIAKEFI